jgi:predicted Zn-dependent peptidase
VDPDLVERAFEEELERLGREPVTADELARAKALIETFELEALQRVEERADRLAMYATLLDDPDFINRQLERYLSVTPEQIQAVAAEVFRPDNRVVITYVPASGSAAGGADEESAA